MPDLSVIIVSWNVKEKLRSNLIALLASQGDFSFDIWVVDNNSEDGSAAMVKEEFPEIKLIANQDNYGFARANNQALASAEGEFILLLNPDMLVFPDTLYKAWHWAKMHPKATVSTCRLVDARGETIKQVRRFPTLVDQLLVTFKWPHVHPSSLNKYLCVDFDYRQSAIVDSVRGAFFLINRDNFRHLSGHKIPKLDERYFVWFEEVDFCRQVRQLGGQVWYAPEARCRDYIGASFSQIKRGLAQRYFSDSMLKYFKKWQPRWQWLILKGAWFLVKIFI